ncbi:hypothetical protein [Microbacterium aerolatum]|uniref:hypothetical protein n=1 Tax=Microbacterium aerolatum TaxID=153731 RepID=UPI0011BD79AC|nr:hypothetical protein [Microbacterium aerolatum]
MAKAAREAGKSDDEIKDALRAYGVNAKDAERAIGDIGDEFRETGRDGRRAGDDLEDSLRDVQRQSERTEKSVDDIGDKGFRKLGDTSREVGDELKQNLGETFSSFRGDLEDLPQIAQDTLAGLAGSGALGGIGGLAATAAGAAGLGLVIGAMDTINERAEALEARASDMASAFIEAGSTVLDATTIAAAASDVITDPEKRKEVQAYADALGVDFPTAVRAYVGDANALAVVDGVVSDARRENLSLAEEQREALKALTPEQQKMLEANQSAITAGRELNGVVDEANRKYQDQQGVLLGLLSDAGTVGEEIDELGNRLLTLPDGAQILISAETGQASADVSAFEGDVDGVIARIEGDKIVLSATAAQAIATAKSAAETIGGIKPRMTVGVGVDTSQFDREVRRISNTQIRVGARIVTSGQDWD